MKTEEVFMISSKKTFILILLTAFKVSLYGLPATHSYLTVPELKSLVKSSWGSELKRYQSIIDKALTQELIHDGSHHVFYHAQKCEFRIVQDFIKNLYTIFNPGSVIENFHFLRVWYKFPETIDANSFIDAHEKDTLKDWNDNKRHLSKRMLSVNFSLFGNTKNYGHFGECTFKYFFSNKSIKAPPIPYLLEKIFNHFGFNKNYIDKLLALNESIKTNEGSLFQIFVPIEYVDTIAFAAQRLGTPYRNDELMSSLFDYEKKRYPNLTPILDTYCHNPEQFGMTLDRLQGRLLFSQNILLNPLSGVKIFRYTTVQPNKLAEYQHKLKKLTKRIVKKSKAKKLDDSGMVNSLSELLVSFFKGI